MHALCSFYLFFFLLFQQNSLLPVALWFSPLVQLNTGSWPFPTRFFFPLPIGGWGRRFAWTYRDIFPQQANAKDCKEPAGRLRCPMFGLCARTFSDWGSGGWSSQGHVSDRRQHLCRIRRWTVRDWKLHRKLQTQEMKEKYFDDYGKRNYLMIMEWGPIMTFDLLEIIREKKKIKAQKYR